MRVKTKSTHEALNEISRSPHTLGPAEMLESSIGAYYQPPLPSPHRTPNPQRSFVILEKAHAGATGWCEMNSWGGIDFPEFPLLWGVGTGCSELVPLGQFELLDRWSFRVPCRLQFPGYSDRLVIHTSSTGFWVVECCWPVGFK